MFIFQKYLPDAQDQITIVFLSVILSSKKGVPWKSTQFTLQQLNHTSTFPPDNLCHTSICRSVLCILPILSHRILKRPVHVLKLLWNENNFYRFIKDILRWKRLFVSNANARQWRIQWQFGATALIYGEVSAVYPPLRCSISANVNTMKKANVLILLWK